MYRYLKAYYHLCTMMGRTYWSPNKLLEHQNRNLRRIVAYAYDSVPFYHRKFKEVGIKPNDIRSVEDLKKLPLLRKTDIRSNANELVSTNFNKNSLRTRSTSGSTGQPIKIMTTKSEDDIKKVKHIRANVWCGQKARERWVTITAPTNFDGATKFQRRIGIYAPTFVSVFEPTVRQISIIEKRNPTVLEGYSSSLTLLAREIIKNGKETVRPRLIFGGAEMIDDASCQLIEKAFGAPYYDQYASVEFGRLACQCTVRRGYHIDADTLIMEFIDEHGDEVHAEESGEIVCTNLLALAMPLIRYVLGDKGVPNNEQCSCGRTFPLMNSIEGRTDSFLLLPNGQILSPRSFNIAMRMSGLIKFIEQYQIIQKRIDVFEIKIKVGDDFTKRNIIERELPQHIRNMLKLEESEVTFNIDFVDEIPIDKSGKSRAVISELKKNSSISNNV